MLKTEVKEIKVELNDLRKHVSDPGGGIGNPEGQMEIVIDLMKDVLKT